MGLNIDVNKAVKIFNNSDSVKGIVNAVLTAAEGKDFEIIGYHCLPPIGMSDKPGVSFLTFKDFTEQDDILYRQSGCYRHNPFISEPLSKGKGVLWSDIVKTQGLTRRNKKFIEVLSQRFSGEGLAVPVYGPRGQNGVVFFKFNDANMEIQDNEVTRLQTACQQGHLAICKALNTNDPGSVKLTPREREILEALVRGYSNAAIAELLGISVHTVNGYLRQLFLKLGTGDRVSTAIRGLALGVVP